MRLYGIRVDIFEAATNYAFPIVRHEFFGRDPPEAQGYHDAHRRSDAFIRQCEDRGLFDNNVRCRTVVTEGWVDL